MDTKGFQPAIDKIGGKVKDCIKVQYGSVRTVGDAI